MDIHTQALRLRIHLIYCVTCRASVDGPACQHGQALWRGWVFSHRQANNQIKKQVQAKKIVKV